MLEKELNRFEYVFLTKVNKLTIFELFKGEYQKLKVGDKFLCTFEGEKIEVIKNIYDKYQSLNDAYGMGNYVLNCWKQLSYNEYLEYDGKVAEAMFFSTSVGKTENSEEIFSSKVPYLRSVDSKWDNISPVYEVKLTFTLKEFYEKLFLDYKDVISIEILDKTSTGRIKKNKNK